MHLDDDVLRKVEAIIENESSDWWDELSLQEQEEIVEGLAEIERGDTVPHKEVMKIFDKWK